MRAPRTPIASEKGEIAIGKNSIESNRRRLQKKLRQMLTASGDGTTTATPAMPPYRRVIE